VVLAFVDSHEICQVSATLCKMNVSQEQG